MDTKVGYGQNMGNKTPAENQQTVDENSRYAESPGTKGLKEISDNLASDVRSIYLGGYGLYEQTGGSIPQNHKQAIEMAKTVLSEGYDEIAKIGSEDFISAIGKASGSYKIGVVDGKSASFAIDGDNRYIVFSPETIKNKGDKFHNLPNELAHETGHMVDLYIGEKITGQKEAFASSRIIVGNATLLQHAWNELDEDSPARKAFEDMVAEWESENGTPNQRREEEAIADPKKMEALLNEEWNKYIEEKVGIDPDSEAAYEADNFALINKYGIEFLQSERGQELKRMVDDANKEQEKSKEARQSSVFNKQCEKYKKFGALADIFMASPSAPAKRGFRENNLGGINMGHSRQYFEDTAMCGTEIFAELCEIETFHPDVREFIEKWAPNTWNAYKQIMKMAN